MALELPQKSVRIMLRLGVVLLMLLVFSSIQRSLFLPPRAVMLLIQVSRDGLERVEDDETDPHTVHTSARASVCVCYSAEEEASSAKNTGEEEEALKGPAENEGRKHTNIMMLISSLKVWEHFMMNFIKMHLKKYYIMLFCMLCIQI